VKPVIITAVDRSFLRQAIEIAVSNVRRSGGPFGAVVARNGAVIAAGANQVTRTNDPTAHAEIVAIREACRALGSFQLEGCEIYCSCEPCPMCLGAIYWARPARVFFAATAEDAAAAGFDDATIYRQIVAPPSERSIPMIHLVEEQAAAPFEEWINHADKTRY
jgi:guanine deaminase